MSQAFRVKRERALIAMSKISISEVIEKLRDEYIVKGISESYFEINNGRCYDFSDDVVREMGGCSESFFSLEGENFMKGVNGEEGENDIWDQTLLKKYWTISPPKDLTWKDLNTIYFGSHAWITLDNRHYDAECPEGVDNFFNLPVFRRCIVAFLRESGII